MAISDESRQRFEAIGLDRIRRELVVGNVQYLRVSHAGERDQAREWVDEQDAKVRREQREAQEIEDNRFKSIWRFNVSLVIIGFVAAAAAVIAAWPIMSSVIKRWITAP